MARATPTPTTPASEFLTIAKRIRLSQLVRDPYLQAVFRRAEDDGTAPAAVFVDPTPVLTGGQLASVEA